MTPVAPAATASSTKSCASKRGPGRATKRVPGASVRVSVETLTKAVAGSPVVSRPPVLAATIAAVRSTRTPTSLHLRRRAPIGQRGACHFHAVERKRPFADDLVLLVTLPGNQHEVAGIG